MPYAKNTQLPAPVRHSLPSRAQTMFRKAFNSSFRKYGEISAFKIAWSAVKKEFKKKGDKWITRARG